MYATKRRLEVLRRKGQLKTRADLPRSVYGKPVYGARKARFAQLDAEQEAKREAEREARRQRAKAGATVAVGSGG
jgi:hypothetical protein